MVIHDYPKEFIERTLTLMDKCYEVAKTEELEVTFILNCLLGLIIATYEQLDLCQGNFFKKRLADVDVIKFVPDKIARVDFSEFNKRFKAEVNKKSLIGQLDDEITVESKLYVQKFILAKNLTLKEFIRNVRNGIAHQNLRATSTSEHWEGIRIWNYNKDGIKDFEVEFKINQLRNFAKFIGEKFIDNLPEKVIN
jgi:hypothetical protein